MLILLHLLTFLYILAPNLVEASRILVCVPCPSISHQVVFYPLVKELLRRGHEVVFITTDSMYPKGNAPENLTEIDTHEVSYKTWREKVVSGSTTSGRREDSYYQATQIARTIAESFVEQMRTQEVQDMIKNKIKFDLVIIEGVSKSAQVLSHVFKAPMILMNSLGALQINYLDIGAPVYPKLLYPIFWHQKISNMSLFDKLRVLWDSYFVEQFYYDFRVEENLMVKKLFGPDTPSLEELANNIAMLFINLYPIWEFNRPVPPGVLFIGGIHQTPKKDLPQSLKSYLDNSKNGVVYFSLGTNVSPSSLPSEKINAIINGLAKLKYDVLVKWDCDELPGKGNNTKVHKWLPQTDLLRHPKIKAFITQGGLQSFDEALTSAVPLVGIPMLGDQWYNVDRYSSLKIGIGLLMEDLTEDKLVDAVNTVINDPIYKRNMIELHDRIRDQPESALNRAVWWVEHVIRHKDGSHLRAPAANMSWAEYLDLELLTAIALIVFTAMAFTIYVLYLVVLLVDGILRPTSVKFKSS